ncbi:MAG: transporter [Nitrospira sp. CG24E]|nr:MAG: transporter [Nitrospira sp. CG24E]
MGEWGRRVVGIVVCLMGIATAGLAAEKTDLGPQPTPDRNWQVGFNPSYSSGNYGTSTTSTFFYAPLSIRRFFKDGDVALVIPFVTVTTTGGATLVGGQPTQTLPESCFSNSGQGKPEDRPECQGLVTGGAQGQKVTNSGLGDIILRGRYYIVEEKGWTPLIAVTGRLKLPTADESQGLGTGKMDQGVGAELSKLVGNNWILFLDGGFNVIGRPEGRNLRNQWWYDVGGGYYFTKDLFGSVYFEEYRSLISGNQNIRDVFFGMNYRASSEWRFNGGVTVGLSNGAPDYGLSTGVSYRF